MSHRPIALSGLIVATLLAAAACSPAANDSADGGPGTGNPGTDGGSGTTDGGGDGGGDSTTGNDGGTGSDGATNDAGTDAEPTCQANLKTDAKNCGHCGRVCESNTCNDGLCQPMMVLDTPDSPSSFLYAVSISGGKAYEWEYTTAPASPHFFVYSAPAPLTLLAQPSKGTILQDVPPAVDPNLKMSAAAFDATYVYEAAPGATAGGVSRKKLDGTEATGDATALFGLPAMDPAHAVAGCAGHPTKPASAIVWKNLVVAGNAAYLAGTTTANGSAYPCPDSTAIYAISPFPATATTQATQVAGLGSLGEIFSDLTVVGGHLFWFDNSTDTSKRSLFTAPIAGGAPVLLEDDVFAGDHAAIAGDDQFVYWTIASSQGSLRRAPLANLQASAATTVAPVDSPAEGLVVDAGYVYFMTVNTERTVSRVPKAGGTVDDLGSMSLGLPGSGDRVVGVDDTFLYITDLDAKIYRMYKKP